MYNFLDPKLLPKVSCKSPCTDNYEVENLISDNFSNKLRGFIAYSAIKPPVAIEFELICSVNLHYIVLNTSVGTQKCTGIEIFAKNSTFSYTPICKAVFDDSKSGVVCCNSRRFSKNNPPKQFNSNYHLTFFKGNAFRVFLNATAVKVVIFRTEKSVPCMGSVEAWGTVSKLCSPTTFQTIKRIMQKSNAESTASKSNLPQQEEFAIPEDYKDGLTCEIMTIPMTLPSGNSIDQSTLEKHVLNEKSFGRKPCDPFTGVKFTEQIKPVLNVALKSRIDMFLLQHADKPQTFNLKRSLRGFENGANCANGSESKKKVKLDHNNLEQGANDLDLAIAKAKSEANFTSFTCEKSNTDNKNCCTICKVVCDYFYEIPCRHYYCRLCLLEVCKELKCSVCNKLFAKSDVKKCNL